MKDFGQLKSYQQLDLYYKWLHKHREKITVELREEYALFREYPKSDMIWRSDFGGWVGVPLFVVTILWIASAKTEYQWFIAAGMIGFGFWLRAYQKHIIDLACRNLFKDTRDKTLLAYVERCKDEALELSESDKDGADIYDFYEYCRRSILSEDFHYYEKGNIRTKRKHK